MKRIGPVGLSMLVSSISVLVVLASPLVFPIRDGVEIRSPYAQDLEGLLSEGREGLTPAQSERLRSLIEENNQWFEEQSREYAESKRLGGLEAWKRDSELMTPFVALLWGISFYLFMAVGQHRRWPLVLVVPCLLAAVQLVPVRQLILILLVVLSVRAWFFFRPSSGETSV